MQSLLNKKTQQWTLVEKSAALAGGMAQLPGHGHSPCCVTAGRCHMAVAGRKTHCITCTLYHLQIHHLQIHHLRVILLVTITVIYAHVPDGLSTSHKNLVSEKTQQKVYKPVSVCM